MTVAQRPLSFIAQLYPDGTNYVASPKWVLFGHHFAAIAGAGPLVGPTPRSSGSLRDDGLLLITARSTEGTKGHKGLLPL